jgi:hypothetical protein
LPINLLAPCPSLAFLIYSNSELFKRMNSSE